MPIELKFKSDTKLRKQYFTPEHFAHPAKMHLSMLLWIVRKFTKPGEMILDPMAGSGTTMLACTLGRNVILVELEKKFCKMMKDNWKKVSSQSRLDYKMGTCQIIQSDSRNLTGILVDKCIFSPPFSGQEKQFKSEEDLEKFAKGQYVFKHGRSLEATKKFLRNWEGIDNPHNIGNLPYGSIDAVISSPPYEGSDVSQTHMTSDERGDPNNPNYRPSWNKKLAEGYAETKRPYTDKVDAVISSPPYEHSVKDRRYPHREHLKAQGKEAIKGLGKLSTGDYLGELPYGETQENIGNLKSDSYLSAMLQVYQQCYQVLKDGGLMILVTKNFIRNKKQIRLDLDTIKLCKQSGFKFVERHYRKLTTQSFWRTIYHQKYPEVPKIDKEDILVFKR